MTDASDFCGDFVFHCPAMVKEVVELAGVRPGSRVVDTTVGGGGHARAMLEAITPGGELIGIDRDQDAINEAIVKLDRTGFRVRLIKGRMGDIGKILNDIDVATVDAIVADLGVSSFHLDSAARGFSFREDAPLDMRMDGSGGETAEEWLRNRSETEIEDALKNYGEERYARRIARAISRSGNIKTTMELVGVVAGALPPKARHQKIHPATRTFQALRIAVNDEMGELERFLAAAPERLNSGGRIVVISYHSLEDRRVKHAFKKLATGGSFRLPVKGVVTPSDEEIKSNPRVRSAKLRVLERVN